MRPRKHCYGSLIILLLLIACEVNTMKLTSTAFRQGEKIPAIYTCDGNDINPPLQITDIPKNAKTFVLIVDDTDAPRGTWTHWVVFNIEPLQLIPEKSVPGLEAMNDFKRTAYGGPCPPSGIHRYFFKLYALDKELELKQGAARQDIEKAMQGHIVATAELMGTYSHG